MQVKCRVVVGSDGFQLILPKNERTKRSDRGWHTRAELCNVLDVSGTAFDAYWRRYATPDAIRGSGRNLRFHARTLLENWLASKLQEAGGDPMLAGEDSPALERYRSARAALVELDLKERCGELVKLSSLEPLIMAAADVLRNCGIMLQRSYGAGAQDTLEEGLTEIERLIDRFAEGKLGDKENRAE